MIMIIFIFIFNIIFLLLLLLVVVVVLQGRGQIFFEGISHSVKVRVFTRLSCATSLATPLFYCYYIILSIEKRHFLIYETCFECHLQLQMSF